MQRAPICTSSSGKADAALFLRGGGARIQCNSRSAELDKLALHVTAPSALAQFSVLRSSENTLTGTRFNRGVFVRTSAIGLSQCIFSLEKTTRRGEFLRTYVLYSKMQCTSTRSASGSSGTNHAIWYKEGEEILSRELPP